MLRNSLSGRQRRCLAPRHYVFQIAHRSRRIDLQNPATTARAGKLCLPSLKATPVGPTHDRNCRVVISDQYLLDTEGPSTDAAPQLLDHAEGGLATGASARPEPD